MCTSNPAVSRRPRLIHVTGVAPWANGLEIVEPHKGSHVIQYHAVGGIFQTGCLPAKAVWRAPEHGVDLLVQQMKVLVGYAPPVHAEAVQELSKLRLGHFSRTLVHVHGQQQHSQQQTRAAAHCFSPLTCPQFR